MVQIGTYAELLSSSTTFPRILDHINQYQNEQQQSSSLIKHGSRGDSTSLAKEEEEEIGEMPTNDESKQEGTVKWNVFVFYLQGGVGVVLGVSLIIVIFSMQQALGLYSSWWLAKWSNDEGHRHKHVASCTNLTDENIHHIRSMNDSEWNDYRNGRFYIYASKLLCRINFGSIFLRSDYWNIPSVGLDSNIDHSVHPIECCACTAQ